MKLEELLALIPVPIAVIDQFDLQYLGLGEWVLHCWWYNNKPSLGRTNHVLYKTPQPANDPHGKRWDRAPRHAIFDLKKLKAHHEAVKKVLG